MSERRVLRGEIVERRTPPRPLVESPEELAAMLDDEPETFTYVRMVPYVDPDDLSW